MTVLFTVTGATDVVVVVVVSPPPMGLVEPAISPGWSQALPLPSWSRAAARVLSAFIAVCAAAVVVKSLQVFDDGVGVLVSTPSGQPLPAASRPAVPSAREAL